MQSSDLLKNKIQEAPLVQYPVLIAQQGPLEGQRWAVDKSLTIGRDPGCDIVIPDRQVSRLHAKIHFNGKVIELEDMGSKNGTFLLGEMLPKRTSLADGTVFQIALVQKFVFYLTDATMPMEDVNYLASIKTDGSAEALLLDKKSHRVWIGKKEILPPLSVPQFTLLEVLFERPGMVITRNELVDFIWGNDQSAGVSDQALDALIRRLRERLAEVDSDHNYIVTIRGHGLRFENR
jgi:pSer/pThr/pTyr-binding forkhead associated (FHA) protein